ncbi:MAG TPA: GIY-YIG nuclease family protein [Nitrosopumilaceae archaeon]|nr:GIY-YIG nuclease family protein [Nitrosopumilaceae archaeon]
MELLEEKVHLWLDSSRFVKAKPGVYVFYDKKFGVIYIGASENLQKEFAKYMDTNFENNTCKQKTHTYQRIFIENPEERKTQLLEEYKKKHGNFPCCNDEIS